MTPSASAGRPSLVIICLASFGWAFSFGLASQVVTLWLKHAGCSDTVIGHNAATYYLGIAVMAGLVPGLMRRWGPACAVAGMALTGLTLALVPLGRGPAGWLLLPLP